MAPARPQDRDLLKDLFRAAVEAVDGENSTARWMEVDRDSIRIGPCRIHRSELTNVWIVGGGKATASMASAAEKFLLAECADSYRGGLIVVKEGHGLALKKVTCLEAGHPLPDRRGEAAASRLLNLVKRTSPDDIILCLLSGGASALMPAPAEGITLTDKIALTEIMLKCGADIHEINALRKHCSQIKGGRLAAVAPHATWVTLAISDVPGDAAEAIGSGPTVGDPTTLDQCWEIITKYNLENRLPPAVIRHLKRKTSETPKPEDELFSRTHCEIVAGNIHAVKAARKRAEQLGYHTIAVSRFFSEDVKRVSASWESLKEECDPQKERPYMLICGGEPTVKVKGRGKGGRNTELALRVGRELSGRFTFLSAGTDGTDGPTEAAGAFVDEQTVLKADAMGMTVEDYLDRNDSFTFFEKLGDLFVTGPTRTNVMDLQILMVWE